MPWIETTTQDGRTIELRTESIAAIADHPGGEGSDLLFLSGTTLSVRPGRKEMRDQIEEAERRRTFPTADVLARNPRKVLKAISRLVCPAFV